jgi:hypothetical protein
VSNRGKTRNALEIASFNSEKRVSFWFRLYIMDLHCKQRNLRGSHIKQLTGKGSQYRRALGRSKFESRNVIRSNSWMTSAVVCVESSGAGKVVLRVSSHPKSIIKYLTIRCIKN